MSDGDVFAATSARDPDGTKWAPDLIGKFLVIVCADGQRLQVFWLGMGLSHLERWFMHRCVDCGMLVRV